MAVVAYQCTTCKRTINLIQNKNGLDWIGRCNITLGCRGTLVQQEVYPDYVRGSLPADVVGLKNWVQRQILYTFQQTTPRTTWVITHNLGVLPSVQVYVNVPNSSGQEILQEVLPKEIIYNNTNMLTLIFDTAYSGTAQLIARASNPNILNPQQTTAQLTQPSNIQLTNNGILTIATRASTTGTDTIIASTLQFTPSSGVSADIGYIASNAVSEFSPWSDATRVMIRGKVYYVRTIDIQTAAGTLTNGSTVSMTNIDPSGSLLLQVASFDPIANAFYVANDYTLYFTSGSLFTIQGTNTINDRVWTVSSSSYDPDTKQTAIVPTDVIPSNFPSNATILQNGTRNIEPYEVLVLLGDSPFTIYDKLDTAFIDMDFLTTNAGSVASDIYYNGGELYASTSIVQSVYPPIIILPNIVTPTAYSALTLSLGGGNKTVVGSSSAGTTGIFTLTANTDEPSPIYTWSTTAGTLSSTSGQNVTLTLPTDVDSTTLATITCVVKGTLGTASATTTCTTINQYIGISLTGGGTVTGTGTSGTTGTFNLSAGTSNPSPSYLWSTTAGVLSAVSGPSVTLTLPTGVGTTTTANVTCTVNGTYGTASKSTTCTTSNQPNVTVSISGEGTVTGSGSTGTTGTFTLTATTNDLNPTYNWSTSAGTLSSTTGNPVTLTLSTAADTTTIANVTCDVNGVYGTASATTTSTTQNDFVEASVSGGGVVSGTGSTGTTGTFTLTATTNDPNPTFNWSTNGAGTLSSTTGSTVTLTLNTPTDTVTNVTVTCDVNGTYGTTSATTSCIVQNSYTSLSINGNGTVTGNSSLGTTGTFTLTATTNVTSPTFSWSTSVGTLSASNGSTVTLTLPTNVDTTTTANVTCNVTGNTPAGVGNATQTVQCTTTNQYITVSIAGSGTVSGTSSTGTTGTFNLAASSTDPNPSYSWSTTAGTLSATTGSAVTLTLSTGVDTTTTATVTCNVNGSYGTSSASANCTTSNSYVAVTTGGGGCFSGNTRILTTHGYMRFDDLPEEFYIVNHTGKHRAVLLVHPDNIEPVCRMGDGFVTSTHPVKVGIDWLPAKHLFHKEMDIGPRTVYNLHVVSSNDDDRHYLLENGLTVHNLKTVGGCFSGNTYVLTDDGYIRFDQLPMEFNVINHTGTHKAVLVVHDYNIEPLRRMGDGFVTEGHNFKVGDKWVWARDLFHEPYMLEPRTVYNLHVISNDPDDHHYILKNGFTVHNTLNKY